MFAVPAVTVPSADFLGDALVSCVICVADVIDAIVDVPSTLSMPAVELCVPPHGPFRGGDVDDDDVGDDDDVDDEEAVPPQEDAESAASAEEPAIHNNETLIAELIESFSRLSLRSVKCGNVQVREHSVTLGDHPLCDQDGKGGYPISLDWAHTEVKEYELDWYEETKPEGLFEYTAEGRKFVIEDVSGMEMSTLESLEEERLQQIEQERLEQQQRRLARLEARRAARALHPVRRSARLANKAPQSTAAAPPPSTPFRRSPRLANKVRCCYKD